MVKLFFLFFSLCIYVVVVVVVVVVVSSYNYMKKCLDIATKSMDTNWLENL